MTTNASHRLICGFFFAALLLTLASCRQIEPNTSVISNPEIVPRSGQVGKDEIGEYTIVSERGSRDDKGFDLRIEERVYENLSKTRFVVTQSNLGLQAQSIGIKSMNVFVYQGDTQISTNNINTASLLNTAGTEISPASSEVIFASEPYEVKLDETFYAEQVTDRPCGVVKLDYVDETYYPIVLDTCDRPTIN
jgi:hypothetical protein